MSSTSGVVRHGRTGSKITLRRVQTMSSEAFDARACETVRLAFTQVFKDHPEVRSLALTIVWVGALDDAQIHHGIWVAKDADNKPTVVSAPDAVYGSLAQTLRMLDNQLHRAAELNQHLREQCAVLGTEVINKSGQLKKLEEEIAAKRVMLDGNPACTFGADEDSQ
jgi:hypothetical protein